MQYSLQEVQSMLHEWIGQDVEDNQSAPPVLEYVQTTIASQIAKTCELDNEQESDVFLTAIATCSIGLVVGTSHGHVCICSLPGEVLRVWKPHTGHVTTISCDTAGEIICTGGMDGGIAVINWKSNEQLSYIVHPNVKWQSIQDTSKSIKGISQVLLAPEYGKDAPRRRLVYSSTGGTLKLYEQRWLGRDESSTLHSRQGGIAAIAWSGRYLAWANERGVKVHDTHASLRVASFEKPLDAPSSHICPPRLLWIPANDIGGHSTPNRDTTGSNDRPLLLIIGWGTSFKIFHFAIDHELERKLKPPKDTSGIDTKLFLKSTQESRNMAKEQKTPERNTRVSSTQVRLLVDETTDAYICGLASIGEDAFARLLFDPPSSHPQIDVEAIEAKVADPIEIDPEALPAVEMQVFKIDPLLSNNMQMRLLNSEYLPLTFLSEKALSNLLPRDMRMVSVRNNTASSNHAKKIICSQLTLAPENALGLSIATEVLLARPLSVAQQLDWYAQQRNFADALALAFKYPSHTPTDYYFALLLAYFEQLAEAGHIEEFLRATDVLLPAMDHSLIISLTCFILLASPCVFNRRLIATWCGSRLSEIPACLARFVLQYWISHEPLTFESHIQQLCADHTSSILDETRTQTSELFLTNTSKISIAEISKDVQNAIRHRTSALDRVMRSHKLQQERSTKASRSLSTASSENLVTVEVHIQRPQSPTLYQFMSDCADIGKDLKNVRLSSKQTISVTHLLRFCRSTGRLRSEFEGICCTPSSLQSSASTTSNHHLGLNESFQKNNAQDELGEQNSPTTIVVEEASMCARHCDTLLRALAELFMLEGDSEKALRALLTQQRQLVNAQLAPDVYKTHLQTQLDQAIQSLSRLTFADENDFDPSGNTKIKHASISSSISGMNEQEKSTFGAMRALRIVKQQALYGLVLQRDYYPALASIDPVAAAEIFVHIVDASDLHRLFTSLLNDSMMKSFVQAFAGVSEDLTPTGVYEMITRIWAIAGWWIESKSDHTVGTLKSPTIEILQQRLRLIQFLCLVHSLCRAPSTGLRSFNTKPNPINGGTMEVDEKNSPIGMRKWHIVALQLYLYFRPELSVTFLQRSKLCDITICLPLCRSIAQIYEAIAANEDNVKLTIKLGNSSQSAQFPLDKYTSDWMNIKLDRSATSEGIVRSDTGLVNDGSTSRNIAHWALRCTVLLMRRSGRLVEALHLLYTRLHEVEASIQLVEGCIRSSSESRRQVRASKSFDEFKKRSTQLQYDGKRRRQEMWNELLNIAAQTVTGTNAKSTSYLASNKTNTKSTNSNSNSPFNEQLLARLLVAVADSATIDPAIVASKLPSGIHIPEIQKLFFKIISSRKSMQEMSQLAQRNICKDKEALLFTKIKQMMRGIRLPAGLASALAGERFSDLEEKVTNTPIPRNDTRAGYIDAAHCAKIASFLREELTRNMNNTDIHQRAQHSPTSGQDFADVVGLKSSLQRSPEIITHRLQPHLCLDSPELQHLHDDAMYFASITDNDQNNDELTPQGVRGSDKTVFVFACGHAFTLTDYQQQRLDTQSAQQARLGITRSRADSQFSRTSGGNNFADAAPISMHRASITSSTVDRDFRLYSNGSISSITRDLHGGSSMNDPSNTMSPIRRQYTNRTRNSRAMSNISVTSWGEVSETMTEFSQVHREHYYCLKCYRLATARAATMSEESSRNFVGDDRSGF